METRRAVMLETSRGESYAEVDRLCAQLNAKMGTDERVGPAQTHVLKAGAGWERGVCGRWSE